MTVERKVWFAFQNKSFVIQTCNSQLRYRKINREKFEKVVIAIAIVTGGECVSEATSIM